MIPSSCAARHYLGFSSFAPTQNVWGFRFPLRFTSFSSRDFVTPEKLSAQQTDEVESASAD